MLSRRDLLRLSALTTAAGCTLGRIGIALAAEPHKFLYGVQLYTMRKELAADFPGMLHALRQIGLTQLVFTQPSAT